jgi:hypothetical protein
VKDLRKLKSLKPSGTQVTDAGLKELKNLKNLGTLILQNTQVGDMGLKELNEPKLSRCQSYFYRDVRAISLFNGIAVQLSFR